MSFLQQFLIVTLRFVIGWHLFYEGLGKMRTVNWSAAGYLANSSGPFAEIFKGMAGRPQLLGLIDTLVVWGLLISGLFLMLGLFSRTAALVGFLLVFSFFLAAPPLTYMGFTVPGPEGAELYVNKTLIEALSLFLLAVFPTGRMAGLDILLSGWRHRRKSVFSRRA